MELSGVIVITWLEVVAWKITDDPEVKSGHKWGQMSHVSHFPVCRLAFERQLIRQEEGETGKIQKETAELWKAVRNSYHQGSYRQGSSNALLSLLCWWGCPPQHGVMSPFIVYVFAFFSVLGRRSSELFLHKSLPWRSLGVPASCSLWGLWGSLGTAFLLPITGILPGLAVHVDRQVCWGRSWFSYQ